MSALVCFCFAFSLWHLMVSIATQHAGPVIVQTPSPLGLVERVFEAAYLLTVMHVDRYLVYRLSLKNMELGNTPFWEVLTVFETLCRDERSPRSLFLFCNYNFVRQMSRNQNAPDNCWLVWIPFSYDFTCCEKIKAKQESVRYGR